MNSDEKPSEIEISPEEEKELLKREKTSVERDNLLNSLVLNNIKNLRQRVAYILNNFPPARNSDITLSWKYWKLFESHHLEGDYLTESTMMKLTKQNSISRSRAKIQNEYGLFKSDESVQEFRSILRQDHHEQEIADKPSYPVFSVYLDESGKTQKYVSVGSLWITDFESALFSIHKLKNWLKERDIDFEFHFAKVKNQRLDIYKQFFSMFASSFPSVGFKVIVVNRSGFSDINSTITDLTYHLIKKGIVHENESGRATLPRLLHVNIDDEEIGSDMLKLENIKERIESQNIEGLHVGRFEPKDSSKDLFVQVSDLFVSAINRKIHSPDGTQIKDELANFILDTLNFDFSLIDLENSNLDSATVFNLTF